MGWTVTQSHRKQGGYNIVNTVSRHAVGHAPTKAQAWASQRAINASWSSKPLATRRRRENAYALAILGAAAARRRRRRRQQQRRRRS